MHVFSLATQDLNNVRFFLFLLWHQTTPKQTSRASPSLNPKSCYDANLVVSCGIGDVHSSDEKVGIMETPGCVSADKIHIVTTVGAAWRNSHQDYPGAPIVEKYWHHDDVINWKHFPRHWPFVRGIHRSLVVPLTKASEAELWCFLWSAPEQKLEQAIETLAIWDTIALIITSL